MDQTPEFTKLNQLRRVLELSNRTTPAERNSEVEWKTPSKGGYPEHSPRSHAMKWLESEEAFLTLLRNLQFISLLRLQFTPLTCSKIGQLS